MECTFLYLHQSTNIQYSEYFHSLVSFKLINNVHKHVWGRLTQKNTEMACRLAVQSINCYEGSQKSPRQGAPGAMRHSGFIQVNQSFLSFFLITIPGSGSAGTSFYSRKEVSLELWSCAAASARWWFATFPFPWCEVTPDKRGVSAAGDLVERSEAITTTYRSSPSSSSSRLSWTSAVTTELSAACRLQEGDEWNKGSSAGSLSGSSSGKLVLM